MGRTAKQRGPLPPSMPTVLATMVLSHPEMTAQELADACGLSVSSVQRMAEVVRGIDISAVNALKVQEPVLQTILGTKMALKSLELIDSDPRGAVSLAFGAKLSAETRKALTPEQTSRPGGMVAFIEHLDNRHITCIAGDALKPPSLDTTFLGGDGDAVNQALTVGMSDNDHSVNQAPPQVVAAEDAHTTGVGGGNLSRDESRGSLSDAETLAEE